MRTLFSYFFRLGFLLLVTAAILCASCTTARRVSRITKEAPTVDISLPGDHELEDADIVVPPKQDTLEIVDLDGHKFEVFKGHFNREGDLISNEELTAAIITARFRNVAERHGKVVLEFQITVPQIMLEQDWQTRFYPDMYILEDSVRLDMLILTGEQYRKTQMRGYQRYNNFLASIVSDTTKFINIDLLERFLQRNIPQVYAFKTDSTFVSEEHFESCFGVTEREAIEHYTNQIATFLNDRRKSKIGAMYRRYVKAPYITEGVRLDTVFVNQQGDFVYNYTQVIDTRPQLRKVDIVLSGEIFQQDLLLYRVPECAPLTFYISSVSSFTDNTERYLTRVIERRVEANTTSRLAFQVGKADIVPTLEDNAMEIDIVASNLRDVLENEKFDLDSILIRSYASPEGSVASNDALALRRAASASDYFSRVARSLRDSITRAAGMSIVFDGDAEGEATSNARIQDVSFLSRAGGENWEALDELVRRDTTLTDEQKDRYFEHAGIKNADERENRMKGDPSYSYIREHLYPELRTVTMDFYLHRKGMVQDTVHTTELDTTYMRGVQAIRDRDYDAACVLLAPYQDFNTAVAYVAADRNMSAMQILEPMEKTPVVNYMLAILYSRLGDAQKAVQSYMDACREERSYINRGNLDPEIRILIETYGLFKDDDDDLLGAL